MTIEQKEFITATVPVLKENGVLLTRHFYNRMFTHHPELRNMFNMGNQETGKQQTALALAVLAYAENIADPMVLLPVVDRIGHKHVSLDIRPEHYSIVGRHLIASIREVLGESATPGIIDAWTAAYNQLAALMSGHESELYQHKADAEHGWTGWRPCFIRSKVGESDEITSLYLYPSDGGQVLKHLPGQFLSLRTFLPQLHLKQSRQYSISSAPDENFYRISVKREAGRDNGSEGLISNYIHNVLAEGDIVDITAPSGNFTLDGAIAGPVTLISGGVGLTPLLSMLQGLVKRNYEYPIHWLHGCRGENVHAFKTEVDLITAGNPHIIQSVFYNEPTSAQRSAGILQGHLSIDALEALKLDPAGHYFICGPAVFIDKQFRDLLSRGIQKDRIYFEEFGPQLLNLN
jgi:nitric oxide dioxygenase